MKNHLSLVALSLAACIHAATPAEIQSQQRAAIAQNMGYPTKKSAADLDAAIAQQTNKFTNTGIKQSVALDAPAPVSVSGEAGVCYTLVMHLASGATWGAGAEPGLKFQFASPTGQGSGGPGIVGPGAVVSLDCAEADGPISMTVLPIIPGDTLPFGTGALDVEVWSHKLTPEEMAHREAAKQQEIKEQREEAAARAAEENQRASSGCSICEQRYQGCLGAGRSRQTCDDGWDHCAFDEVGATYMSACSAHQR